MATYRENKEFLESVLTEYLLDEAIDWVVSNIAVDDVFSKDVLETWAEENGYEKTKEE